VTRVAHTDGPAAFLETGRYALDLLERRVVIGVRLVFEPVTGVGEVRVTTVDGVSPPDLPAFDLTDTEETPATAPGKGRRSG
jgi:hypothetical protein